MVLNSFLKTLPFLSCQIAQVQIGCAGASLSAAPESGLSDMTLKQWLVDEISQIKPQHLTISQADALVVYVYCDLRSSILSSSLEVIPFQLARLYLHHMGLVIVLSMAFLFGYFLYSHTSKSALY
ncbi:uncharacterized protein LOC124700642 [Lolium rigidum]|uniref:uncharacterized protein LOC124700642 n=1 Tax=Lolium rigidum TaxID=89674 RepID=UPI001F5C693B|nr:uncharacterized protein LOC124700642 [Lolium rigidum]